MSHGQEAGPYIRTRHSSALGTEAYRLVEKGGDFDEGYGLTRYCKSGIRWTRRDGHLGYLVHALLVRHHGLRISSEDEQSAGDPRDEVRSAF